MEQMLDQSCRVALAGLLHDLGKFAERARLEFPRERLDALKTLDCPQWEGRFTHIHAAYTSAGFFAIEDLLPRREQLMGSPFAPVDAPDADDSLINAAARHHKPETFLQWIIATADRLASGFERSEFDRYNQAAEGTATGKNHYQARLLPLFESIALEGDRSNCMDYCLPLAPLSAQGIFPQPRKQAEPTNDAEAQAEYARLWSKFVEELKKIPASHRQSLTLWLDHFDAAWLTFTHAIPSATAGKTKPDVSLYDHSKAVAALAVALWRWHAEQGKVGAEQIAALKERSDWHEKKFLLVQGDFSGIQDFIFAEGGETQRRAARLLRGRSFQVSLLTELAALAVLDALALPPTSQIVNAAGKFLIVAPNTPHSHEQLTKVRARIDSWFLEHTFGESSINIAMLPASCEDFTQERFGNLIANLFAALETAKLSRFNLCGEEPPAPIRKADFSIGPCAFDGRRPAQSEVDGKPASHLATDQITIGKRLVDPAFSRLLVTRTDAEIASSHNVKPLVLDYFGYRVAFVRDEENAGRFGDLVSQSKLLRCWDISLPPAERATPLFRGYARRDINAYVPWKDHEPVALDELACKDTGIKALAVLKGDVDHLGAIFQQGIQPTTFARLASVSRQMNAFFSIHLPWLVQTDFSDTYTVFAGGDDFFMIGPWYQTQSLACTMRDDFAAYVANNPQITFSASLIIVKPGFPIRQLAREADSALARAKDEGRNRLTSHGVTVTWNERALLSKFEDWLDKRRDQLSTGFIYRLLRLAEKAASTKPEDAIWQSWLAYRVRRFVVDKLKLPNEIARRDAQAELAGTLRDKLMRHKLAAKIAIANILYRYRD